MSTSIVHNKPEKFKVKKVFKNIQIINTEWNRRNRCVVGFVMWKNGKKKIKKKNRRTWPYNQHSMALRVMRAITRPVLPSMGYI